MSSSPAEGEASPLSARLVRTSAACALAWLVAVGLGSFADRVDGLISLSPALVVPLLPVGAIWIVASRAGMGLLGFREHEARAFGVRLFRFRYALVRVGAS